MSDWPNTSDTGSSSGASLPANPIAKTGNYQLVKGDMLIRFNTASGARTATLPPAAAAFSAGKGDIVVLKKITPDENTLIAMASGSDLIDGAISITTTDPYGCLMMQSTGAGWDVLSR